MRLHHSLIILSVIATPTIGSALQDKSPVAELVKKSAPAEVADPMARFGRMVGGEWKVTAQSGKSMYDVWHWGPGRHSLRVMTHGFAASGDPWRALAVVYWHPGRAEVRTIGLNPYAGSVSEGTVRFDGENIESSADLHQTGDRRKMISRDVFEGPDKYHSTLLEETEPGRVTILSEWDFVRSKTLAPVSPPPADKPPKLGERLKVFESLLGRTWDTAGAASGEWADGGGFHTQASVEWIPYANGVYARVSAERKGGEPAHLLDVYVYFHTGAGVLRCLVLSERGGVYEGDITVVDGGALEVDLKGYERDRAVSRVVRVDFEKDGNVRSRVWSVKGDERTLLLDVRYEKLGRMAGEERKP